MGGRKKGPIEAPWGERQRDVGRFGSGEKEVRIRAMSFEKEKVALDHLNRGFSRAASEKKLCYPSPLIEKKGKSSPGTITQKKMRLTVAVWVKGKAP